MALPNIPTSFVPYSASSSVRRFRTDFTGAFGFLAYGVLTVVFILAVGVFLYGRVLANSQASKDAQLATEEQKVDQKTIGDFVRLHDRLLSSKTLLDNHVALSGFFGSIGALLPVNVRFNSLHVTISDLGVTKVEGTGIAKSFNALAVVSQTFANNEQIKDAIFSGIGIGKDKTATFTLSATLDPKVIVFSPAEETALPNPIDSGTTASTTPSL